MNPGEIYPPNYRSQEVSSILSAVRAGECVALVGLSGCGKSNLLAYLASLHSADKPSFVLVDCNRLEDHSIAALFRLICHSLGETGELKGTFGEVEGVIAGQLEHAPTGLCLLFDRYDILSPGSLPALYGNLRALRDAHKYSLTFITATRRPPDPATELAELFYAHILWLGALSEGDARWSVLRYAARRGLAWDEAVVSSLISITSGYPALLRAACEAYGEGCSLDVTSLAAHPAVQHRVAEFWADEPGEAELRLSGLLGQPLLMAGRGTHLPSPAQEDTELTSKEHLLLSYFIAHPQAVCEKDDLIRAVWPEDRIFEQGVRDDSLAQLVRRLRTKIETDPSQPHRIHTVPGRGYRYVPDE